MEVDLGYLFVGVVLALVTFCTPFAYVSYQEKEKKRQRELRANSPLPVNIHFTDKVNQERERGCLDYLRQQYSESQSRGMNVNHVDQENML